jgi:hypothetical protein
MYSVTHYSLIPSFSHSLTHAHPHSFSHIEHGLHGGVIVDPPEYPMAVAIAVSIDIAHKGSDRQAPPACAVEGGQVDTDA